MVSAKSTATSYFQEEWHWQSLWKSHMNQHEASLGWVLPCPGPARHWLCTGPTKQEESPTGGAPSSSGLGILSLIMLNPLNPQGQVPESRVGEFPPRVRCHMQCRSSTSIEYVEGP